MVHQPGFKFTKNVIQSQLDDNNGQLMANVIKPLSHKETNKPTPKPSKVGQATRTAETQTEDKEVKLISCLQNQHNAEHTVNHCVMRSSANPLTQQMNINQRYEPQVANGSMCKCMNVSRNSLPRWISDSILLEPILPTRYAIYGTYHHLSVVEAKIGNCKWKVLIDSGATRSILSDNIVGRIGVSFRENTLHGVPLRENTLHGIWS